MPNQLCCYCICNLWMGEMATCILGMWSLYGTPWEQFYVWLMGHEVRPFNHTLNITCIVITILIHIYNICITIVIITIQKSFQDKFVYYPNYKKLQCDYEWLGIYDFFLWLEFKNLWLEGNLQEVMLVQRNGSTLG